VIGGRTNEDSNLFHKAAFALVLKYTLWRGRSWKSFDCKFSRRGSVRALRRMIIQVGGKLLNVFGGDSIHCSTPLGHRRSTPKASFTSARSIVARSEHLDRTLKIEEGRRI
jgi:hypothetical protein